MQRTRFPQEAGSFLKNPPASKTKHPFGCFLFGNPTGMITLVTLQLDPEIAAQIPSELIEKLEKFTAGELALFSKNLRNAIEVFKAKNKRFSIQRLAKLEHKNICIANQ
jgi:hypothetical protein